MKKFWVVKTEWSNGNTVMTNKKTREDARTLKRSLKDLDYGYVDSVQILKAQEYASGRIYISGKVYY